MASAAAVSHFVYLSVAHPAPVMQAYVDVRMKCEKALAESGLNATVLRPWYVLGPGHRWPYALIPLYKLAEQIPSMREAAIRLSLVTIREMISALTYATESSASGIRVFEPRDIRRIHAEGAESGGRGLTRRKRRCAQLRRGRVTRRSPNRLRRKWPRWRLIPA